MWFTPTAASESRHHSYILKKSPEMYLSVFYTWADWNVLVLSF